MEDSKWIDFLNELGITSLWAILLVFIIGYLAKKLFEFFVNEMTDLKKSELSKDLENLSLQYQIKLKSINLNWTKP